MTFGLLSQKERDQQHARALNEIARLKQSLLQDRPRAGLTTRGADSVIRGVDPVMPSQSDLDYSQLKLQSLYLAEIERHLDPGNKALQRRSRPGYRPPQMTSEGPYKTFGQQLLDIVKVSVPGKRDEGRLELLNSVTSRMLAKLRAEDVTLRAAPAGAGEQVPADGGFLVQPEFSQSLTSATYDQGSLLSRMAQFTCSSNAIKLPGFDEHSRADGNRWGGVKAVWSNEADALGASRPKYKQIELNMHKLLAFSDATNELLADASVLEEALTRAFVNEFLWKIEDGACNGDGAGKPLGVFNSPATIVVPKQTGQASQTIVSANVTDLWARMWGPSRRNAIWLLHPDAEEALLMTVVTAASGGSAVPWFQFADDEDAPCNFFLFGRPAFVTEYSRSLGDQGDIACVDFSQYVACERVLGIERMSSIHVMFNADQMVFRWTLRYDGQPAWHSPITPRFGTKQQSAYVVLAAR